MDKIVFACRACGQQLAVRETHTGRRVRCTSCHEILLAPDVTATSPSPPEEPARPSYRTDPLPESAEPQRSTQPDDFDFNARPNTAVPESSEPTHLAESAEEPRQPSLDVPPRRLQPNNHARLITLTAVILLVVVGGGLGLWLWLRGGVAEDLKLVPSDAAVFVTIRPADVWESYWGKRLRVALSGGPIERDLEQMESRYGFGIEEIERATFVVPQLTEAPFSESMTLIVRTEDGYSQTTVLEAFEEEGQSLEDKHEGKRFYVLRGRALYFHSENVFVMGPEAGVRKCITAGQRRSQRGPLEQAKAAASRSRYEMTVGYSGASAVDLQKQILKQAQFAPFRNLLDVAASLEVQNVVSGYVTLDLGRDLTLSSTTVFKNEKTAQHAEGALGEQRDEITQRMEARLVMNANEMDFEQRRMARLLSGALSQVALKRSGNKVSAKMVIDSEVIEQLVESWIRRGRFPF